MSDNDLIRLKDDNGLRKITITDRLLRQLLQVRGHVTYAAFDRSGFRFAEPEDLVMRDLLASAALSADDHSPVLLIHREGWSISYNRSHTVVRENFRTGEGPYYRKNVPEEEAFFLWKFLAAGNFSAVSQTTGDWPYGYGIFVDDTTYKTYSLSGEIALDHKLRSSEFIASIRESDTEIFSSEGPYFHFFTLNTVLLGLGAVSAQAQELRLRASGNLVGTVSDFCGRAAADLGPNSRAIMEFDFLLRFFDDRLAFQIEGHTAEEYQPWTLAGGGRRWGGRLAFRIVFAVRDEHLNKIVPAGKVGVADSLLKTRNRLLFRDRYLRYLQW